ncbi:hypothetical protein B0T10DRAFT_497074 [Thelonectria olida]|uniref:Transaldolase n=1 Tax=Thelonectria olida TaxID=1576542 RepID=A0A9P9AMB5_9HYPO|nr:hypothetical protein B0T10DRAFT_497074 [Thelonectria olida]
MPTLLDTLRQQGTTVDCDTLNVDVAKDLGPFVDCTSNQAIAYFELSKTVDSKDKLYHEALIKAAIRDAYALRGEHQGKATFEGFAVEIMMVKLQLIIAPHVTGYVHVQTNPKLSYDTTATVENAERIISFFKALDPDFSVRRVCIKVPATWEGMQACRILEEKGIATLATTMFCMEQAALAADARCRYIAPYVNELKVHFEKGYVDENKAFDFCHDAAWYYKQDPSIDTQVLAASLTSVEDVMQLAGIPHITISPVLLHELADTDASSWKGVAGDMTSPRTDGASKRANLAELVKDESRWRLEFTRSGFGKNEGKIISAINYFADFQDKLEELVKNMVLKGKKTT